MVKSKAERDSFIENNLGLVHSICKRFTGRGIEYDDLYQVGALALVSAVERFDPDRGFEFSSFATPTILGEIKKYFRDKQWSLKVPRRLKEMAAKIQEVKDSFYTENHRNPSVEEIADVTGFSTEQIIEAMEGAKAYGTYSLDKTFDDAGEEGESAFLEKYTGFEERGYDRIETSEIIESVLDKLSDQHRYIFKARFYYNKSQAEIAKVLGVSQMTVSRAEKNMINMFKEELKR